MGTKRKLRTGTPLNEMSDEAKSNLGLIQPRLNLDRSIFKKTFKEKKVIKLFKASYKKLTTKQKIDQSNNLLKTITSIPYKKIKWDIVLKV